MQLFCIAPFKTVDRRLAVSGQLDKIVTPGRFKIMIADNPLHERLKMNFSGI